MHKAQNFLDSVSSRNSGNYIYQLLSLMGLMVLLLVSSSVFALESNPGSNAICSAGATKGFLSDGSYNSLISSYRNESYQTVISQTTRTGSTNANIPLKIKMSINDVGINSTGNNTTITGTTDNPAIDINRNFIRQTSRSDISLEFQDSDNGKVIYLNKVAVSVFDIDKNVSRGRGWDDLVKITGINENDEPIKGRLQTISNSKVIDENGLQTSSTSNLNCRDALDSECQGSVLFDEPVKSVTLSYGNTNNVTSPTTQRIQFRLDSYCYQQPPSYTITKDDGVSSIETNSTTDYTIKVTNTGGSALQNITLKDPSVSGLSKQSNITCDSNDTTNSCSTAPNITQLESATGFLIPSIPIGKSYSIVVPTRVTAVSGTDVTNTATISHTTLADKSSSDTNSVTSIFDGGSSTSGISCPANHQMYYVGNNPESGAITPNNLGWNDGDLERDFIFDENSGNKIFKINFTAKDTNDSVNSRQIPFYGSIRNVTSNAINFAHNTNVEGDNNSATFSVNWPVSKIGFVVQDLDSAYVNNNPRIGLAYAEYITIKNNGNLTFFNEFHTREQSGSNTTVKARDGENCRINECNIDATWGYTAANNEVSLSHGARATNSRGHTVGYSDFYFCLAPPKLIVKKELEGTRINDAANNTDQFQISVTDGSSFTNSFTTTGSGSTINNGSSSVLELNDNTTYTITERVMNSSTLGDIGGYSATYTCTNATTNSTTVMPSDDMTYDSANQTRSFTLSNVTYGDEITCTITNTPSQYTFSGIVFNDNGGISSEDKFDTSSTFTGNSSYFNGQFDSSIESGVSHLDLKVSLNDCNGTIIDATNSPNPQSIPISGQYSFIVQADKLPDNNTVCITEIEPDPWSDYPVDTTPNEYEFTLKSGVFNYKTGVQDNTGNTLNLDFGEVIRNQSALVLTKSQYVHQCDDTLDLTNPAINQPTSDPMVGFSDQPPSTNVDPGQCIAYKITATNRGNIDLNDIVVSDTLQKDGVGGATVTSTLADAVSTADGFATDRAIGYNGTISTQPFNLNGKAVRSFYFNTQYGK